jgi:hypothetical protein
MERVLFVESSISAPGRKQGSLCVLLQVEKERDSSGRETKASQVEMRDISYKVKKRSFHW